MLLTEQAHWPVSQSANAVFMWFWHDLTFQDCQYAPNPQRYSPPSFGPYGPSSFHPGGLNVAFADGSVRFIKDTMQLLADDPAVLRSPARI